MTILRNRFFAQYGHEGHVSNAIDSTDVEVRYAVTQNHSLSHKDMYSIAKSDDWVGHLGLSRNPNTPTHIIDKLTQHADNDVSDNALLHKNVSVKPVQDFVTSSTRDRLAIKKKLVARSPHVTTEILNHIINRSGRELADAAKEKLNQGKYEDDLLDQLRNQ